MVCPPPPTFALLQSHPIPSLPRPQSGKERGGPGFNEDTQAPCSPRSLSFGVRAESQVGENPRATTSPCPEVWECNQELGGNQQWGLVEEELANFAELIPGAAG